MFLRHVIVISLMLITLEARAFMNGGSAFKRHTSILRFTTTPNAFTGVCSNPINLQTANFIGTTAGPSSTLTINVSASGITLYQDSDCQIPTSSFVVQTYNTGGVVYAMSATAGSFTVTASANGYATASYSSTISSTPAYLWTGGGANALLSNGTNWSSGSVPPNNAIATFDGSCVTNCSPTINANITMGAIRMLSGYNGTITQNSGVTVTLASPQGFYQESGTYTAGDSSFTVQGGSFYQSGGTFNSTSGTFGIAPVTAPGNRFYVGGAFNGGTGTVQFNGFTATTITPGAGYFNNITFASNNVYNINATLTLHGNLTYATAGGTVDGSNVEVQGDLIITGAGRYMGSSLIKLNGSNNQRIDASTAGTAGTVGSLEIATAAGKNISLFGQINVAGNYTFTSGNLVAGTSKLAVGTASVTKAAKFGPGSYYDILFQGSGTVISVLDSLTATNTTSISRIGAGAVTVEMPNPGSGYTVNAGTTLDVPTSTTLTLHGATLNYTSRTGAGTITP